MKPITREQARDMADAHADGLHAELPREGCPECEDRPLKSYTCRQRGMAAVRQQGKHG